MLNRYKENKVGEFLPIPFTAGRFLVNVEGVLKDTETRTEQVQRLKTIVFEDNSTVCLDAAVVVAIAFKGNLLPKEYWQQLELFYVDENVSNVHPSNLIWKNKEHGIEIDHLPGFCLIPGFSRYAINSSGVVKNIFSELELSPYTDNMGYWIYGVTPDVGKRTIVGMHRLLALAFKEYPVNVCDLDVNHEDGDKTNCDLSNLEWNSRKQNCDHAYSTGLRIDNKPVLVKNLYTGSIREFYSIEECARKLDIDGETIRLRCKVKGEKVFPPGFLFKYKDEPSEWIDVPLDKIESELYRIGIPVPLTVEDPTTNQKLAFPNLAEAERCLNISTYRLRNAMLINQPVDGLIISILKPDQSLISW